MDQILNLSRDEQTQVFKEAAARSNEIKSPIIIEKDFWVCWTLEQIFKIPEISPHITFKGGTSLSKCYNIINRFSEDCDLTISKEFLGISEDVETVSKKSRNQRDNLIKSLVDEAINKINNHIKPLLISRFKTKLSRYFHDDEWKIESSPEDAQSLMFHYPAPLNTSTNEYIQSAVKLEFGARGDNNPNEVKSITPYIHDILTGLFTKTPAIAVNTLTARRTFWEKATLLHAEHHRKIDKPFQNRIFRHYYDIVMLDNHGITSAALSDLELLNTVLMNKKTFFSSPSAKYETAKIGTMRLLPNTAFIEAIKQDCEKMSDMFFGAPPNFDEIMKQIDMLENTINTHNFKHLSSDKQVHKK